MKVKELKNKSIIKQVERVMLKNIHGLIIKEFQNEQDFNDDNIFIEKEISDLLISHNNISLIIYIYEL